MDKWSLNSFFFIIILSIFFLLPKAVFAAAEPIAHFKFDDGSGTTPDDSSTNNVSASFTATNPTWSTDVSSTITFTDPYSLDFSGSGDAVEVTWPSGLDFSATEPRSFSFWYKPTANGEGQYSRLISWSNDRLEIAGTNGTTNSHKIAYFDGNWNDTDITLTLGTWYHIIFTYDGTNAKFYINNELQDEHALAGRALSGTMRIGNRVQQLDEGINGKIDDVRIYDYALNESQIQNLSEGSNNPDGDPTPTPTPTRTPTPTPTPTSAPTNTPSPTSTQTTSSNNSSTSNSNRDEASCPKGYTLCPNAGPITQSTQTIESEGLLNSKSAKMLVQRDASSMDLKIRIHHDVVSSIFNKLATLPLPWQQGFNTVGEVYNYSAVAAFNGYPVTQLDKPVTLILPYDPNKLYGRNHKTLRIAFYNSEKKRWQIIPNNTVINTEQHTIANTTNKFGYYAVVYSKGQK